MKQETGHATYVVGVGAVFVEKMQKALDETGPSNRRFLIDIASERLKSISPELGMRVVADSLHPPFRSIPAEQRLDHIVVIASPNHLESTVAFVEKGFRQFIIEKPLINNEHEAHRLLELLKQTPDLRIYALDFYIQKCLPLLLLAGLISTDDPMWNLVCMENGEKVLPELSGSFNSLVGKIKGVSVTILEGGQLGVPDVEKRPWLEHDKIRGGVLLDLGIHALAPLVTLGMLDKSTQVVHASTKSFSPDRKSLVSTKNKPEMYAKALLNINTYTTGYTNSPLEITVGKIPQEGGVWEMVIRGSKGIAVMGLRSGQQLSVQTNSGKDIQLRLEPNLNPYSLAFREALRYFGGDDRVDNHLRAALTAISVIDKIKKAASE